MAETNEMNFELAIARLEQIVRSLESGNAPLDESLSLFEEGVRLVKFCNDSLDKAESRVKLLTFGKDGVEKKDFPVGDRNGN